MTQNQLPRAWVEKIFTRLQGVYGREFLGQYGTGMVNGVDPGIENAKQVWAEELAGFIRWPDSIAYALEHLPERTPNAIKFRELCRISPRKENKPLELEHKLTEEQMAANKKRVAEMLKGLRENMTMKGAVK
jgi:hypothetical protein